MFVCCECRVLSGRGLCDELITRPEESYRLCCVVVCDLETSRMRRPWPALGRSATEKNIYIIKGSFLAIWFNVEKLRQRTAQQNCSATHFVTIEDTNTQTVWITPLVWPCVQFRSHRRQEWKKKIFRVILQIFQFVRPTAHRVTPAAISRDRQTDRLTLVYVQTSCEMWLRRNFPTNLSSIQKQQL